jgi:arylsulfatase A
MLGIHYTPTTRRGYACHLSAMLTFDFIVCAHPCDTLTRYAGCSFVNTTRRGLFGDALAEVDAFAGALSLHLDSLGVANNTLTLFFSDNGPSLRWGVGEIY